jgi:hypothetical protein
MAHETTGRPTPREREGGREANGHEEGGREEAGREETRRERFGPLTLERHVKDDGRALILYSRVPAEARAERST